MRPIHAPSPCFDARALPVTMIVLHGVDRDALGRCTAADAERSFHYLIALDGRTYQMVDEAMRARHCDAAHWRGVTDIDSASIGIALERADDDSGFPDLQVAAAIRLVAEVKDRHAITRGNLVAASDVVPARRDPGEFFPWHRLARLRLALPRPTRGLMDPHWNEASFLLALERFGYDVTDPRAAIMAFQRRFRPEMIDGEPDAECRMLLLALLLPQPQGD